MDKNRSLDLDNEEDFNDIQEKLHFYLSSIKGKNKRKFSNSQILLYLIIIFLAISILVLFIIGINFLILIIATGISIAFLYFDKKIGGKISSEH